MAQELLTQVAPAVLALAFTVLLVAIRRAPEACQYCLGFHRCLHCPWQRTRHCLVASEWKPRGQ